MVKLQNRVVSHVGVISRLRWRPAISEQLSSLAHATPHLESGWAGDDADDDVGGTNLFRVQRFRSSIADAHEQ